MNFDMYQSMCRTFRASTASHEYLVMGLLAEAGEVADKYAKALRDGPSLEFDKELAKELGVDKDLQGVVVRKVQPGSPADRAGVRSGDVILEIDNAPVTSMATFSKAIKKLKSGETAIVVVQRGERSQILEMKMD